MSTNKQTPPAAINEDEIYSGAEANNVESSRAQAPDIGSEIEEERQQTRKNFQKKTSSSAACSRPTCQMANHQQGSEQVFWDLVSSRKI
ncbi:hypothetical protein G6F56_009092 [Rhizopus delemar]|nr:hypothetical protein G6F56_009092 [Rhizopus delemar]